MYDSVSIASIAQMVERKTLNLVVVGSIPTGGALLPFAFGAGAIGCPWGPGALIPSAALAQLGERQTEDLKVPGSIPGGGTHFGFGPHCVALGSKAHSIDTARAVFGYRPDSDPFDAALVRLSIGSKACAGPRRIRRHRFSNPAPNPENWILPILCGLALPDGSSLQEGRDWTRGSHAATNPPSRHRQHAASAHPIRSHRPEIGLIGS